MRVKQLVDGIPAPTRARKNDGGYQLRAAVKNDVYLDRGQSVSINTGFSWRIPDGYVGLTKPWSVPESCRLGVMGGVIYPHDDREVKVLVFNIFNGRFVIESYDIIAEMVVVPHYNGALIIDESLGETDRGDKGFGSAGV